MKLPWLQVTPSTANVNSITPPSKRQTRFLHTRRRSGSTHSILMFGETRTTNKPKVEAAIVSKLSGFKLGLPREGDYSYL